VFVRVLLSNCVQDIQDELADLMMDANEIQEMMGRSYGYFCTVVVLVCKLRVQAS
jgi:hypothetical protein